MSADLVVTDPPYNMKYEGAGRSKNRKEKRILNDDMPEEKFAEFLHSAYEGMAACMKDGASFYAFYKEMGHGTFLSALEGSGLDYRQELVWVKSHLVFGGAKYQNQYEACVFGSKGKVAIWNGKRNQRSVLESLDMMNEVELREAIKDLTQDAPADVIRADKQLKNDLHPTMKPIKLLAKLIRNSSNEGDVVLDLFGGSGSTMIACEQLGRKCCMGDSITGGGLHGKDLSKADVSVNIYAFCMAQLLGHPVEFCCAIGDSDIDGIPYNWIVDFARKYIDEIGGFEKFAEWGLIR